MTRNTLLYRREVVLTRGILSKIKKSNRYTERYYKSCEHPLAILINYRFQDTIPRNQGPLLRLLHYLLSRTAVLKMWCLMEYWLTPIH